jgi:hypothetical protein
MARGEAFWKIGMGKPFEETGLERGLSGERADRNEQFSNPGEELAVDFALISPRMAL